MRNHSFRGANLQYVASPTSLGNLSDVTIAANTNLDLLQYSSTASKWIDIVLLDQDDMSSNSATQPATQQSIKAYVDAQIATEDTIAELNDTTISGPAANDVLQYSGSAWVDRTYAEAGIVSLTGSETLTNKTLTSPTINGGALTALTDLDMTVGNKTIFDTVGSNTLTVGASGTTVSIPGSLTVSGTTTTVSTTNTLIADKLITLNDGGSASSGTGVGIEVEEDSSATGYFKTAADRAGWELKAPSTAGVLSIDPSGNSNTITFGGSGKTFTISETATIDQNLATTASVTFADLTVSGTSTTIGTVTSGVWEGTTVAVAQGGTGATTLNNLITLGTHTTGNYAATITGGTGITSSGATSGEGIAHSLSVDASQTQITAVGTIATGTWEGTTVAVDQGGTGATSLNNLITLSTHTTGNYVATVTGGTGITSTGATSGEGIAHSLSVDASQTQITALGTIATGVWQGTDVGVAYGGTGVSTLTDGGILLGSGSGAITAMAVLADSEMIVGNGSTDPVAESGATLRTSIGVGTSNSVEFAGITGTTIDATTDFTIGDTVITNGVITDSSGLKFTADVYFGADGTNQDVYFYGDTSPKDMTWDAGANALILKDDAAIRFGTGSDSIIKFDGSDTYWDLQAAGTGGLTIALGNSPPAPDQDSIHIWKATAGTVTAASNTLLTLENSGDTVLQLLHGNSDAGIIYGGGQTDTNNYHGILMRGSGDSPASTMQFRIADSNRLNYSAGEFAFQEATNITTTTSDLTLNAAASLNVTLTDDDADAFDMANSAVSYYKIDTRNTVATIAAHDWDTEDAVIASGSTARYYLGIFRPYTLTYTGTTQVTSLVRNVDFGATTITDSSALTVNKATNIYVVAPTEAGSVTLAEASAIRIANASGTPTTQAGIWIEDMTAGATNDYGLYIEDADTYALFVDAGVSRFDGNVSIGATASDSALLHLEKTGTTASPHIRLTESGDAREGSIYNDGAGGIIITEHGTDNTEDSAIVLTDVPKISFKIATATDMHLIANELSLENSTITNVGNSGSDWTAGSLNIQGTGSAILRLQADSDANSTDDAKIVFYNDGTGSGDATWAIGHDGSDSEKFKISQGEQVDTAPKLTIEAAGNVGIGTTSPHGGHADADGANLDIQGNFALVLGSDASAATRTNSTTKNSRIGLAHYTNAEEPMTMMWGEVQNTYSQVTIGGGSSWMNAVEEIRFYTATNTTTTGGTLRAKITDAGDFSLENNDLLNVGASGNDWSANNLSVATTNAGGDNMIKVENSSTAANSNSILYLTADGSDGTSDAFVRFNRQTGTDVNWRLGYDNSNSVAFVLSNSNALGTNDALRVTNATPPVTTYNTTHPTGTFSDYACDDCGKSSNEMFDCCGIVRWRDDVMDFRAMALRDPDALDYMERVGVIERTTDNDGNPEIFTVLGRDFEFAMSAAFQNRERMDAQNEAMDERLKRIEQALGV